MGDAEITSLMATAAVLGVVHTLTGPDHYVPFVAMARVGRWSLPRTVLVTALCGVGHVVGSIALGAIGVAAGLALGGLEAVEAVRGSVAGWLLFGFGLAYLAWGLRAAVRNRPHTHLHVHVNGSVHTHEHIHREDHAHPHVASGGSEEGEPADSETERSGQMTAWVLFTIFVFGPCEPLIPVLMYPAARLDSWGVVAVAAVFAACTIATMTAIVTVMLLGLRNLKLTWLARYSHAMAGLAIMACGAAVQLGL